jgi:UDP-galactopyranose mutase
MEWIESLISNNFDFSFIILIILGNFYIYNLSLYPQRFLAWKKSKTFLTALHSLFLGVVYYFILDYFASETINIKVLLNSDVKVINLKEKKFKINNKTTKYDIVISSISPDFFFNDEFGKLNYIGRDFHKIVFPTKNVFPKNVYFLYYANSEKFTRLVEYKKFTKHKSNTSLVGIEFPSKNGKHYPLPFKSEILKSHKYLKKFPEWFFSIGRAGTYRYEVDIDDAIEQAMEIKKIIDNNNYQNAMPLQKWWEIK